MSVISSYFKEGADYNVRADVVLENDCYVMKVYDNNGLFVIEKSFPGKSLHYAESAAENWALGFQII
tara:strand:+ start:329 stop:529 length:201 start_codon:yes stop_codon:yes gene_type:complete